MIYTYHEYTELHNTLCAMFELAIHGYQPTPRERMMVHFALRELSQYRRQHRDV